MGGIKVVNHLTLKWEIILNYLCEPSVKAEKSKQDWMSEAEFGVMSSAEAGTRRQGMHWTSRMILP